MGLPLRLRSPATTQALDAEGRSSAREPRANPPGSLLARAIASRSGPGREEVDDLRGDGRRQFASLSGGGDGRAPADGVVGIDGLCVLEAEMERQGQPDRFLLPVVRDRPGLDQRHHQAVAGRPGLRRHTQDRVLHRRVAIEGLVHAVAEGSNDLAVELRDPLRIDSRSLLEAPSPHRQVELHRGAEQDLLLAHQLRDPPLAEASQHVELEEAVARLDESDRASQVDRIGGLDVRDSVVIEVHVDVGAEPLQAQGLVPVHRMIGAEPVGEDRSQRGEVEGRRGSAGRRRRRQLLPASSLRSRAVSGIDALAGAEAPASDSGTRGDLFELTECIVAQASRGERG